MEFLYGGESKYIEYKREYTKSILKTVSAMANYHDGYIIIGIENDLKIIGVDNPIAVRLALENSINDNLVPRPYYEIIEKKIDDKTLVILKVYLGENTPYRYNSKAYKRVDTSTVPTDRIEYENLILRGRNIGYDSLIYHGDNLHFEYLNRKISQRLGIGILTKDIFRSLGLMKYEEYTTAAALLSDNNPINSARMSLVRFDSDTMLNIKDRSILKNISIIEAFDKSIDFYEKHINKAEIIKEAYRETVEEVPLVAFREAIANAIVHRDYMIDADIRVEFFDDRIEVMSPGGLPIGITEEEYLEGRVSIPRNSIIADIFLRLGIIERLATGIRRIKGYYRDKNVQPEFLIAQNSIKVILPKINSSSNLLKRTDERTNGLTETELKILKYIDATGRISRKEAETVLVLKKTQTVQVLNEMVKKGILIKLGSGKNTIYVRGMILAEN